MRICILANALAVHTQRWAKALAERGHDVTVLSIRQAEIPGVRVITKAVGPINSSSRLWSLLSYLRLALAARHVLAKLQPDVVNPHYCITHGSIARFAGARPVVVNLWGSDVVWDGGGKMPGWRRWLVRYALERASAVVSTSHFMKDEALRLTKLTTPISVVPFGVDLDRFAPGNSRPNADNEGIHIGYVKTMSAKYAPDVFLRAAAKVLEEIPEARFTLAGRGPLSQAMKELARELGIERSVSFPGFIAHDDIPELMRSLDILVNCSRFHSETFGVVILEASATGLPVVATDVGGVRETLREGETGLLVPQDDAPALAQAILRLAKDDTLRKQFGETGRRMVEQCYEWRKNVDSFETLLEKQAKRA